MQKFKGVLNAYEVLLIISLVAIDQTIKLAIDLNLQLNQDIITNSIFSITKIYNNGVSFSFLENKTNLILLISCVAIIILLFIKKEYNDKVYNIGIILILGGAIGNLVDRLMYKHVIDYIQLNFIRFPIFNVADILISFGFIVIIIYEVFKYIEIKRAMKKGEHNE